jgi:hypothetical protein
MTSWGQRHRVQPFGAGRSSSRKILIDIVRLLRTDRSDQRLTFRPEARRGMVQDHPGGLVLAAEHCTIPQQAIRPLHAIMVIRIEGLETGFMVKGLDR